MEILTLVCGNLIIYLSYKFEDVTHYDMEEQVKLRGSLASMLVLKIENV